MHNGNNFFASSTKPPYSTLYSPTLIKKKTTVQLLDRILLVVASCAAVGVEAVENCLTKLNSPKMSDSYAGRTAYTPPMKVIATKVEPMNMLSGTAL